MENAMSSVGKKKSFDCTYSKITTTKITIYA